MALRGTIAVARCQCGFHGGIILTQPPGKALQLAPGTGEHPLEPGFQTLGSPLPHHLCKGLRVGGQRREERIGLLDLEELALLGLGALLRTAEQALRHLAGGQRRWSRWAGSRCSRGAAFAAQLAVPPGGQYPSHAPVPPTEALGAHLVPELCRAVLPGLPALPQIHPIPCETTAIAGATFPFRETLLRAQWRKVRCGTPTCCATTAQV